MTSQKPEYGRISAEGIDTNRPCRRRLRGPPTHPRMTVRARGKKPAYGATYPCRRLGQGRSTDCIHHTGNRSVLPDRNTGSQCRAMVHMCSASRGRRWVLTVSGGRRCCGFWCPSPLSTPPPPSRSSTPSTTRGRTSRPGTSGGGRSPGGLRSAADAEGNGALHAVCSAADSTAATQRSGWAYGLLDRLPAAPSSFLNLVGDWVKVKIWRYLEWSGVPDAPRGGDVRVVRRRPLPAAAPVAHPRLQRLQSPAADARPLLPTPSRAPVRIS